MRIGIFGGTYDPVHTGHIETARSVFRELELDKLFMVVAADPPHKHDPNRTPAHLRLKMLEAALEGERGIAASDVEIKRAGKSYTVDTLGVFKRQYRGAELFLIVGGDMLENFPLWRDPKSIMSMAALTAVTRPDSARDMRAIADGIERDFGGRVILSEFTGPDISSTEIRRRMRDAEPINLLCDPAVERFIYTNGLYMPQEMTAIRQKLYKRLRRKRLDHTMMTVREAISLAAKHGADPRKARLAAILHDCIKLPNRELLEYCETNGYELSADERANPYLIHSRLGAELAETEFGVTDPEVLNAIRRHTLGQVGMSLLDKIIYVADKIEPSREYEGVAEMREEAYRDIDSAMLLVMKHSADYTAASGRQVNPSTRAVMDWLAECIENKRQSHNDTEENNG
jgi:nicotinate-nucleotide adenylyltransferase